jgi:hypothetical protein
VITVIVRREAIMRLNDIKEYEFEHIVTPKKSIPIGKRIMKVIRIVMYCLVVAGSVGFGDHKGWLE